MHLHTPVAEAQLEALNLLKTLSLDEIATKRAPSCSEFEIFCVMLMRAMMSDCGKIIIVTPFNMISTLLDIKEITDVIFKLDVKKDIIIIDMQNNRTNYEGDLCRIAE